LLQMIDRVMIKLNGHLFDVDTILQGACCMLAIKRDGQLSFVIVVKRTVVGMGLNL